MDLREFIDKLREAGELKDVNREVDWNVEASALFMKIQENKGPALLLNKVKGYDDARIVSGMFAGPGLLLPGKRRQWKRVSMALNIDANKYEEFVGKVLERLREPIKPNEVDTGPCKEKTMQGWGLDVTKLPFPKHTERDGGRYGHGCIVVKDPDTGLQVWSFTRFMIVNKNTLAIPLLDYPESSVAKVFKKSEEKGEKLQCAIVLGGDPSLTVATQFMLLLPGTYIPETASSLSRTPLELVKTETSDLLVPADAEVVIEGELLPRERVKEGPFTGAFKYYRERDQPVMKIKAITMRKNPIIPVFVEPAKFGDYLTLLSLMHSAELKRICDEYYFGTVRWVHLPVEARLGFCIVAGKIVHPGWPWVVSRHLYNNSVYFDKIIWVSATLDPDFELEAAFNDWVFKAHPQEGWIISEEEYRVPVNARYPSKAVTSTMLIVADFDPGKFKKEWLGIRCSFEEIFPEELRKKVVEEWKEYGFEVEPIVKEVDPYWAEWPKWTGE